MSILKILQIAGAVLTIASGLLAAFNPLGIQGFTGLTAPGARGVTEFRAVFGGAFIGLGLAVLLLNARPGLPGPGRDVPGYRRGARRLYAGG